MRREYGYFIINFVNCLMSMIYKFNESSYTPLTFVNKSRHESQIVIFYDWFVAILNYIFVEKAETIELGILKENQTEKQNMERLRDKRKECMR